MPGFSAALFTLVGTVLVQFLDLDLVFNLALIPVVGDQQQKQLELILAIAKASKLFEANRGSDAQPSVKPTDGRRKQVVASERIQTVGENSAPPINL
ncbi:hypothetical protein AKJ16_DCAP21352 [Drosera capensis]